ncbi:hypothetical protein LINPERHAP2_LOCUS19209 [Linum perenne]
MSMPNLTRKTPPVSLQASPGTTRCVITVNGNLKKSSGLLVQRNSKRLYRRTQFLLELVSSGPEVASKSKKLYVPILGASGGFMQVGLEGMKPSSLRQLVSHTHVHAQTQTGVQHTTGSRKGTCAVSKLIELNTKHLVREMYASYGIHVSNRVFVLAKNEAKRILEGSLNEAYAKLRPYLLQLKKSDLEGKFVVEVDPVPGQEYALFKRIYIDFICLRKGCLMGCKKLIALDGCFLKGEVKGMILTAVGKDGNNQMFPIVWAVFERENRDSLGMVYINLTRRTKP